MVDREKSRTREPEPAAKTKYDRAMERYERIRARVNHPYVVKDSDVAWEDTRQGRLKIMASPELQNQVFPEMRVFKHEIADKSGRHTHQGGFAILGLEGEGATLIDGERIPWTEGDLIVIPFKPEGVEHQHFNYNDPDEPAVWLATHFAPFLIHVGAMFTQNEDSPNWQFKSGRDHHDDDHDHGPGEEHRHDEDPFADFDYADWADYEPPDETDTVYEDFIVRRNLYRRKMANAKRAGNWTKIDGDDLEWELNPQGRMKWYLYPSFDDRPMQALLYSIQEIPGGSRSGKQCRQGGIAHYVIEGSGYSIVNGRRREWEAGDYLGLPAKPDGHILQHFNENPDRPVRFVRAEPYVHDAVGYDLGSGFKQLESCPEYFEDD